MRDSSSYVYSVTASVRSPSVPGMSLRGAPVWKLWGLSIETLPPTNYTIGIDDIDVMVAKMQEFPAWPVYKIKLGSDHDLEIVAALRRHTDSIFRVDANCGWNADETIANSQVMKNLGVEFIEQPLPPEEWDAMREVFRHSALPVIADESCVVEEDVERERRVPDRQIDRDVADRQLRRPAAAEDLLAADVDRQLPL